MAVASGIQKKPGRLQNRTFGKVNTPNETRPWRHLAKICLAISIVQSLVMGCGSELVTSGSHTKQLGNRDFPCTTFETEQISAALRGMPEGFLNEGSFQVGKVDRVKNQLTGMPRPYLEWLFALRAQNGFRIGERNLGPGVMGVTVRNGSTGIPLSVEVAARADAIDFALQHEIGHALETRVLELNGSFASAFNTAYRNERSNQNLRSYARSSATEYFAEAFANFYCSKDAQEFIASNVPETYALLKKSFLPASFDEPSAATAGKDTWLMLVDDREQTYLDVSFPASVKKAALCKGSSEECTKNPTIFATLTSSPTKISGRAVFRSESEIKFERNLKLTVLVYDTSDKVHAAKSVEFLGAGGP